MKGRRSRRRADPLLAYLGRSPPAEREVADDASRAAHDLTLLTDAELEQLERVMRVLENRMRLVRAFVPDVGS